MHLCAGEFFLRKTAAKKNPAKLLKLGAVVEKTVWHGIRFIPSFPSVVTRPWKAYLLSSGLLFLLSEVISAELSLCSHLSPPLLHIHTGQMEDLHLRGP